MGSGATEEALKTIGHGPRFAQLDLLVDGRTDCIMQDEEPARTGGG
ncbi:MAG: hypothetical protein VXW41_01760 [SAR324 cluster bacterium]|nr:hypothetical protein [SAR324 cluster bacterium]